METYYQLIDKDSSAVSVWWKVTHIFWFVVVTISGYISAYSFGKSVEFFGDNCILFANISFKTDNSTRILYGLRELPSNLPPINAFTSTWGDMDICYFCQCTPIMSMITAIVWGAFFLLVARGGAGYITDMIYVGWKLVYPALTLAAIASLTMLISTIKLQTGIKAFCSNFEEIFNTTRCVSNINEYTLSFSEERMDIIRALIIALYCSYICLAAWVLQLTTLILRIIKVVDFETVQITVLPLGKEQELPTTAPDGTVKMKKFPYILKNNRWNTTFGVKKKSELSDNHEEDVLKVTESNPTETTSFPLPIIPPTDSKNNKHEKDDQ